MLTLPYQTTVHVNEGLVIWVLAVAVLIAALIYFLQRIR